MYTAIHNIFTKLSTWLKYLFFSPFCFLNCYINPVTRCFNNFNSFCHIINITSCNLQYQMHDKERVKGLYWSFASYTDFTFKNVLTGMQINKIVFSWLSSPTMDTFVTDTGFPFFIRQICLKILWKKLISHISITIWTVYISFKHMACKTPWPL